MSASLPPLLLTRPEAQSKDFAGRLAQRLDVLPPIVITPVLEIVPCPLEHLPAGCRGVVMTSAQAARAIGARPELQGLPAHVVGERTAEAASAAGLRAVTVAPTAEALLARLRAEADGGPLLYLRGDVVRVNLKKRLENAGTETVERIVYEQHPRPLAPEAATLLARPGPVAVPLFSPRSAAIFAGWVSAGSCRATLHLMALSRAVAEAWPRAAAAKIGVAPEPTADAMVEYVASFYRGRAG